MLKLINRYRFIVSIYHPHLKLVAHTELLFPKSVLRAEELNNSISKSVNACPHHKQYRTDRVLPQVSKANLVVSQRRICSMLDYFNYKLIAVAFKEKRLFCLIKTTIILLCW